MGTIARLIILQDTTVIRKKGRKRSKNVEQNFPVSLVSIPVAAKEFLKLSSDWDWTGPGFGDWGWGQGNLGWELGMGYGNGKMGMGKWEWEIESTPSPRR